MKQLMSPLALAALARAKQAGGHGPKPRPKTNSRTADKYKLRGYAELFSEVAGMGSHEGRSANSEVVAAILDGLAGHVRSRALVAVLKAHLGPELTSSALADVPVFRLENCTEPGSFIIRFPESIRATIRQRVNDHIRASEGPQKLSMNTWMLRSVAEWMNLRRQQYALLNAVIAVGADLSAVLPELAEAVGEPAKEIDFNTTQ